MLADGFIRLSYDKFFVDKGIYAIELSNFLKFWKKDKSWGYDDLQRALLRKAVHWFNPPDRDKGNLVLLRIATENLDTEKLTIRSQNKLFENENMFSKLGKTLQDHLRGMTPAIEAPLYRNRREAIEYIYGEDIPIESVQQIGNIVNIASLRKDIKFSINPVKFILQALLANTPEGEGLKNLN